MPRLMPSARPSGPRYRNFAIGVLAAAAIIAMGTDGSSSALAPQDEAPTRPSGKAAMTAPAEPLAASAWRTETGDAGAAPDLAEGDEPLAEGGDEEATAPMPSPGRKGPADRPTPAQLEKLLADSRLRSGAPPDGD